MKVHGLGVERKVERTDKLSTATNLNSDRSTYGLKVQGLGVKRKVERIEKLSTGKWSQSEYNSVRVLVSKMVRIFVVIVRH